MFIGLTVIVILGAVLFGVLRADLKKAKQGKEGKFWEVNK